MSILKQSTAATVKLGPFVDDTDGKTAETSLTISQADIRLSKNGGDIAQSHNSAGATHDELGYYNVPLDATDTDTLGRLRVAVSETGALPVWQDFIVVTANVFDSLFSTDKLDCAVVEIATDALTAAAVKADAVTKIQSGLATPTNITAASGVTLAATQTGVTIPTVTTVTNAPTDMAKESTLTAIKGAGWNNESILSILNSISLVGGGSSVDEVYSLLSGLLGAGWTNQTIVALKAVVDAIKAKTDNLPTDPADESSLEAAIAGVSIDPSDIRTAIGLASANLDTQLAGIQADLDNTSQYKADVSGLATAAALATVDSNVDAIKAKTDNLPADPADQSILAGAIAALPLASDYTAVRAAKLDYLDAAISSRATSGEGTISWTYTLNDQDAQPIPYATIWVTSDAGGTAIEASGQTDAAGQVTFLLNAGTYYVWRKKRGYRFTNPDVEVVV
jgi:hypothetical protein